MRFAGVGGGSGGAFRLRGRSGRGRMSPPPTRIPRVGFRQGAGSRPPGTPGAADPEREARTAGGRFRKHRREGEHRDEAANSTSRFIICCSGGGGRERERTDSYSGLKATPPLFHLFPPSSARLDGSVPWECLNGVSAGYTGEEKSKRPLLPHFRLRMSCSVQEKEGTREEMSRAPVSLAPLRASGSLNKPPISPPTNLLQTRLGLRPSLLSGPDGVLFFFVVGLFRVSLSSPSSAGLFRAGPTGTRFRTSNWLKLSKYL